MNFFNIIIILTLLTLGLCIYRYNKNTLSESFSVNAITKIFSAGSDPRVRLIGLNDGYLYDELWIKNGYRRPSVVEINGIVYVSGSVSAAGRTPSYNSVIGTLPRGYWPDTRLIFHVVDNEAGGARGCRIDILPNGSIMYITAPYPKYWRMINLDGIYFFKNTGNSVQFGMDRKAHYVKVRNDWKYLHMAEVKVYDEGDRLISQGKPAKQRRTYPGGDASKAVDGSTGNGNWSSGSISHTQRVSNNWWILDLKGGHNVKKVEIYNRQDCCDEQIAGSIISLLDQNKNEIASKVWDPKDYQRADNISTTVTGRKCQNWASNSPHKHWIKNVKGVKGRSGAIIDRFDLISENGESMYSHGVSNGGAPFNFQCPGDSVVKRIKYNPYGWWGKYSWMGGLGPITCSDGTVLNKQGKGKPPRWTWNLSNWKAYGIGNHNKCRNVGSRNLWCFTDSNWVWDYCKYNTNYKDKIYPKMKTFNFNMKDGNVPTGWRHYSKNARSNGGYRKVSYSRNDNFVVLSGLANFGTTWPLPSIICRIPKDYAPKYDKMFTVSCHNGMARVIVFRSGVISVDRAIKWDLGRYYGWIPLDGISWPIEKGSGAYKTRFTIPSMSTKLKIANQLADSRLMSGAVYKLRNFTGNGRSTGMDLGDDQSYKISGDQTIVMNLTVSQNGRQNPIDKAYGHEGAVTIEASGGISYYFGQNYRNYVGFNFGRVTWGTPTHIAITRKCVYRYESRTYKYYCPPGGGSNGFMQCPSGSGPFFYSKRIRVYKHTTVKGYINGKLVKSQNFNLEPSTSNAPLLIGRGYVNPFKGEINNLILYNRTLNDSEVNMLKGMTVGEEFHFGSPMVHKHDKLITLSGVLTTTATLGNTTYVATLPTEYRPNRRIIFSQNFGAKGSQIAIDDDGRITYYKKNNKVPTFISLDGITFLTYK